MYRHGSLFQSLLSRSYLPRRTCTELPQGIQYPGFIYYPRDENFKDPPYEPSKLFFIKRIKTMKGRNPNERRSLEHLNIDGKSVSLVNSIVKRSAECVDYILKGTWHTDASERVKDNGHVTVVKNIPEVNALLWTVKHLVEIKPILVKGQLPKDGDYSGTFLRHTGEFVVSSKLKVSAENIEASEKFLTNGNKLSRFYLTEYLRKKWVQGFSPYE